MATAASAATAVLLILLFGAWFELTFYEAWLTPSRWLRFPILFFALLPWHLADRTFLGSPLASNRLRRFVYFFASRGILWLVLLSAIFYLRSAQFVFVLLIVYFALFSLLQRMASDVIRDQTRSIPASAIFGAILLAGFCPGDSPHRLRASRSSTVSPHSERNLMAEIVIIGGGPSGAMCGEQLARSGNTVNIFDEHLAWEKPCGGGLTHKAIQRFPFSSTIPIPKNWFTPSSSSPATSNAPNSKCAIPSLFIRAWF